MNTVFSKSKLTSHFSVAPLQVQHFHNVQHNGICPSLVPRVKSNPAILEGKLQPRHGKIFSGPDGPSRI
jgi:hypothetical protein